MQRDIVMEENMSWHWTTDVLMSDVFGPQTKAFGKLPEALDQLEGGEVYVADGGAMRYAYWREILTATAKKEALWCRPLWFSPGYSTSDGAKLAGI